MTSGLLQKAFETVYKQFYGKSYTEMQSSQAILDPLNRHYHGIMHAAGCAKLIHAVHQFYSDHVNEYDTEFKKIAEHFSITTDTLIELLQISALFHDSARENDGEDFWDAESGKNVYDFLLSNRIDESLAKMLELTVRYKDDQQNFTREFPSNIKFDFVRQLVQMADCLEILRLRPTFNTHYLAVIVDKTITFKKPEDVKMNLLLLIDKAARQLQREGRMSTDVTVDSNSATYVGLLDEDKHKKAFKELMERIEINAYHALKMAQTDEEICHDVNSTLLNHSFAMQELKRKESSLRTCWCVVTSEDPRNIPFSALAKHYFNSAYIRVRKTNRLNTLFYINIRKNILMELKLVEGGLKSYDAITDSFESAAQRKISQSDNDRNEDDKKETPDVYFSIPEEVLKNITPLIVNSTEAQEVPPVEKKENFISQSELHLKMILADQYQEDNLRANVTLALRQHVRDIPELTSTKEKEIINKAVRFIETEKENPQMVYFYHACDETVGFLYEVYTLLYQILHLNSSWFAFRNSSPEFSNFSHISNLMAHYSKGGTDTIFDSDAGFSNVALSVNIFLFGNSESVGSNSMLYFMSNGTARQFKLLDQLKSAFLALGVSMDSIEKLMVIFNRYVLNKGGSLYQISIPKDNVSKKTYAAKDYGAIHSFQNTFEIVEILDRLRQVDILSTSDTHEYCSVLQARLLASPDDFLQATQVRFTDFEFEQMQEYKTALQNIMREMSYKILSSNTGFDTSFSKTPLMIIQQQHLATRDVQSSTKNEEAFLALQISRNNIAGVRKTVERYPELKYREISSLEVINFVTVINVRSTPVRIACHSDLPSMLLNQLYGHNWITLIDVMVAEDFFRALKKYLQTQSTISEKAKNFIKRKIFDLGKHDSNAIINEKTAEYLPFIAIEYFSMLPEFTVLVEKNQSVVYGIVYGVIPRALPIIEEPTHISQSTPLAIEEVDNAITLTTASVPEDFFRALSKYLATNPIVSELDKDMIKRKIFDFGRHDTCNILNYRCILYLPLIPIEYFSLLENYIEIFTFSFQNILRWATILCHAAKDPKLLWKEFKTHSHYSSMVASEMELSLLYGMNILDKTDGEFFWNQYIKYCDNFDYERLLDLSKSDIFNDELRQILIEKGRAKFSQDIVVYLTTGIDTIDLKGFFELIETTSFLTAEDRQKILPSYQHRVFQWFVETPLMLMGLSNALVPDDVRELFVKIIENGVKNTANIFQSNGLKNRYSFYSTPTYPLRDYPDLDPTVDRIDYAQKFR